MGHGQDGLSGFEIPILKTLLSRQRLIPIPLQVELIQHDVPGTCVNVVLELEMRYGCLLTLFPTGDDLSILLDGLGHCPCNHGLRRIAVWINIPYVYPQDMRLVPYYFRVIKRGRILCYSIWNRLYFSSKVWKSLGLDKILTTNPDFIKHSPSQNFHYLPEIYRLWDCVSIDLNIKDDNLRLEVKDFLNRNRQKTVLLYYGNWAARRGFDDLLALALQHQDTVFISCGRPGGDTGYKRDVSDLINKLHNEGRILNVHLPFIPFHPVVADLFNATKFIVLPYRDFYGMSASMIEAASYGKPVLVPDIGYLKARVDEFGIGLTFCHHSFKDLCSQFNVIRYTYSKYVKAAYQFAKQFDMQHINSAIEISLIE